MAKKPAKVKPEESAAVEPAPDADAPTVAVAEPEMTEAALEAAVRNAWPAGSDKAAIAVPADVAWASPFSAAQLIALERFGAADAEEIAALVGEQALGPDARAKARFARGADENLCHAIENDPRFKAALAQASAE